MDFALLPPEINSARMYTGPGSTSMVASAEAWNGLASELYSTANSYRSVIATLTAGPWQGPSSAAMTGAASSFVSWLSNAAAQAEETASQAQAAATAYEEAFAQTVSPALITSNRSLLTRLVATNLFGQNTSAIATLETQYAEMWAQDVAAMFGYAGSSASATALTPFTPPPQTTNSAGTASQAAAVVQAGSTPAGSAVASIQQSFSAIPSTLQSLASSVSSAAASDPLGTISDLISIFFDLPADLVGIFVDAPLSVLGLIALPFDIGGYGNGAHTDDIVSGWNGEEKWPGTGPAPVKPFPATLSNLKPGTIPPPSVTAELGEAKAVGFLSVPPTWTIATPAVRPVAYTLPALQPGMPAAGTADQGATLGSSSLFGEMAVAGLAGRAIGGSLGAGAGRDGSKTEKGERVPAAAGGGSKPAEGPAAEGEAEAPESQPRPVVIGVAAELREFSKLKDEGILSEEEYAEQKNRLLGR